MTSPLQPLVSLGLLAYNEDAFIGETLKALLSQDYGNLEIVISDDASTDHTGEICRRFAEKDKRIRYHRNEKNLGLIPNANRVIQLSHGDFFMFAGAHDWWDPHLVSALVEKFSKNPAAVICFGRSDYRDENGQFLRICPPLDTQGLTRFQRINKVFEVLWANSAISGLIRMDTLKKTDLYYLTWASDLILVAELSLLGEFCLVPEVSVHYRFIKSREQTPSQTMARQIGKSSASTWRGKLMVSFPRLYPHLVMLYAIGKSPYLSLFEKVKLSFKIIRLALRWFYLIAKNNVVSLLPNSIRSRLKGLKRRFMEAG